MEGVAKEIRWPAEVVRTLVDRGTPAESRGGPPGAHPPEVGQEVHGELLALVATGAIRPVIGRRISMREVAGALDDHEQRRTSGRTVVDVSRG